MEMRPINNTCGSLNTLAAITRFEKKDMARGPLNHRTEPRGAASHTAVTTWRFEVNKCNYIMISDDEMHW